ncbi:MAG: methyltransferase [Micropruina sp.]|uniref:class I SAM-dependent methyltransferase n=1 Tax=Micropruina sp. TaxID=2737536 RepID=UPI0039E5CBD0
MNDSSGQRPDPVTEILLIQAGDLVPPVAILDDVAGSLSRAVAARGYQPRVWCDDVRAEQQVPVAWRRATPDEAVTGARTVLWRLPRAVSAVQEYAELIAATSDPDVRVISAERDKQLSRSMNTALARCFGSVSASLGHRKARALLASDPIRRAPSWPQTARVESLGLDVVAHGATFGSNRLDHGTALLAGCLDRLPDAATAIDLGCGSGILAALLARRGMRVHAVDVAWSGTDASRLTAEANDLSVEVIRRDGLRGWDEPVEMVVTNPPFHVRAAKDTSPTRALFAQAGEILTEGGELWCVYNAHLPYLPWLRGRVGPTRIMARDRAYLVTRSIRTERTRHGPRHPTQI